MDGVAVLRHLLTADAAVTAIVPATRIFAGPSPKDAAIPFIRLVSVSKVDLPLLKAGAERMVSERVQVTVVGRNYPEQRSGLRAVRHAAADQLYPTVPGISAVTVHTDGAGPDLFEEDIAAWSGSQDFRTIYTEER